MEWCLNTRRAWCRHLRGGFLLPALVACGLVLMPTDDGRGQTSADESGRSPSANVDDVYSVLFLAADGPIWLTLRFEASASGIESVRTRYAALLIRSVDENESGAAEAAEAIQLPRNGRPFSDDELLGDGWTQFDTTPQDDSLSAKEYLTAIEPFLGPRLVTRRKPPLLAQSVQLLSRLDHDRDRQISRQELTDGIATLSRFDFDDDGTFSPAELQPFPQSMVDAAQSTEIDPRSEPFLLVDGATSPSEIVSRLLAAYGTEDGTILPERSGLSEFAFNSLDRNGSGALDADELAVMIGRPRPAARIIVNLSAGRVTLDSPKRGGPRVEPLPVESRARVALRLGAEAVEFSAKNNRYGASDEINLLRTRFLQGDRDDNGYMGPEEFPSLTGLDASFEEVDTNGDGRVFLDELDQFVRVDSYLSQCAVEMEVESIEKPLFGILDADLDRRLTAREFAAGHERMREFDQDGDGLLDAAELDALRRFRVKFSFVLPPAVRPERNAQMTANRRMPVTTRQTPVGPEWFQNMDRNQDGDVTWREFLGPKGAFSELDADASGWIDHEEAAEGNLDRSQ